MESHEGMEIQIALLMCQTHRIRIVPRGFVKYQRVNRLLASFWLWLCLPGCLAGSHTYIYILYHASSHTYIYILYHATRRHTHHLSLIHTHTHTHTHTLSLSLSLSLSVSTVGTFLIRSARSPTRSTTSTFEHRDQTQTHTHTPAHTHTHTYSSHLLTTPYSHAHKRAGFCLFLYLFAAVVYAFVTRRNRLNLVSQRFFWNETI